MLSFSAIAAVLALALHIPSTNASNSEGVCSGAGANPEVYNFEVNGYPAKVIRDATNAVEPGSFFVEDPEVIKRALRRRFLNDSVVSLNFNLLYIDKDGEGVLLDTGNGPGGNREGALLQVRAIHTVVYTSPPTIVQSLPCTVPSTCICCCMQTSIPPLAVLVRRLRKLEPGALLLYSI